MSSRARRGKSLDHGRDLVGSDGQDSGLLEMHSTGLYLKALGKKMEESVYFCISDQRDRRATMGQHS